MRLLIIFCFLSGFAQLANAQCLAPLPSPMATDWACVHFSSEANGLVGGKEGQLWRTSDGGQSWSPADARTALDIRGLYFANSQLGWAVGEEGLIRHTQNGGMSWAQQYSPLGAGLNDVAFVDENLGLAVGDCGALLRTADGGRHWSWADSGTPNNLRRVAWASASLVLIAGEGGLLLRSTDSGLSWQSVGGTGADDHLALSVLGQEAWLSGQGGTYYSGDGGSSWALRHPAPLKAVAALGEQQALGVGDTGLVISTADAGLSWQMWTADALGESFRDLHFAEHGRGYAVGDQGQIAALQWLVTRLEGPERRCADEPATFSADTLPGASYQWTGPDGANSPAPEFSIAQPTSGWYVFTLTRNACQSTDSLFLEVLPLPELLLADSLPDNGQATGQIATMPTGGTPPYSVIWDNGSNSFLLDNLAAGTYTAVLTDAEGCQAQLTVELPLVVSTQAIDRQAFKCWPNPAQDRLTVQLPAAFSNSAYQLCLYAANGRLVKTWPASTVELALPDQALPGWYFLRLEKDGEARYTEPLLIKP